MARELIRYIKLTDDLDGTEGDEATIDTVELGFDGMLYELDLTHVHAKELREMLTPYMERAHAKAKMPKQPHRKPSLPTLPRANGASQRDKDARAAIRAWAQDNGISVPVRGIIKADTIRAYHEANPDAYIPIASRPEEVTNA